MGGIGGGVGFGLGGRLAIRGSGAGGTFEEGLRGRASGDKAVGDPVGDTVVWGVMSRRLFKSRYSNKTSATRPIMIKVISSLRTLLPDLTIALMSPPELNLLEKSG